VKRGVDVVGGVDKQEILFAWDELQGRECGDLDCVAAMEFEIMDVVSAPGELEPISPQAACEGFIAGSSENLSSLRLEDCDGVVHALGRSAVVIFRL
jgi:hypothetical protein